MLFRQEMMIFFYSCRFRNFREGLFSRTRESEISRKYNTRENGEITRSFSGVGKSCSSRGFFLNANMPIYVFRQNKTLTKSSASIGRITHTSSEDLRPASLVNAYAARKHKVKT